MHTVCECGRHAVQEMSNTIQCVTLNYVRKFKVKRPVGGVDVSGRIILKGTPKTVMGRRGLNSSGSRYE